MGADLVTRDTLDGAVDFDRPFRILPGGLIDFPTDGLHTPDVYMDTDAAGYVTSTDDQLRAELSRQGWTPVDGFSGQQGYRGPVMHASEYLGGSMADHVLTTPGVYVVCAVDTYEEAEHEPVGWILLRHIETPTPSPIEWPADYVDHTVGPDDSEDDER